MTDVIKRHGEKVNHEKNLKIIVFVNFP